MPHSNYIFHFVSTFAGFHSEIISRLLAQAEFRFRQRFGTWLFLTDVDGRIEAFKSRCEKLMKIEVVWGRFWFFCLLYNKFREHRLELSAMRFRETKKRAQKSIFTRKILFSSENRNMSNEQVTFAVALLVDSVACEMSSEHETTEVDRNI